MSREVGQATYGPILREGTKRLRHEAWSAGRGIWESENEHRPLTVDTIAVRDAEATAQQAGALTIDIGDRVVVRSRRYLLDDRPIMLAVSALPATVAAGTPIAQADTGPGGIYARLADLGHAPEHFGEDLRARMPAPDEAEALDLDGGTPIIEVARTAYAGDGTPVEFNAMTLDASVYVLRYDFDA